MPGDIKKLWMLPQGSKISAPVFHNKQQVHFRLGSGHRAEHIPASTEVHTQYDGWNGFISICKLQQELSAQEKGSQVQKELFIIPSAKDEQTISPKTHEELVSLTRWLPTRPLRRVYSDYTNCIRRQEANWYLAKLEKKTAYSISNTAARPYMKQQLVHFTLKASFDW